MEAPANKSLAVENAGGTFAVWKQRSFRVTTFAGLIGTKSEGTSSSRSKKMISLLATSIEDHQVVLTLPSLDLGLADRGSNNPLPVIGEHLDDSISSGTSRPTMTASVLTGATEGAANSEQIAAQNIEKLTSWTKSTLEYAGEAVKKNLSDSFASLVESRVRAWTLLLLRHSLSTGDDESRARLLNMLSSTIKVLSAETHFKTLPLPDSAAEQASGGTVILPLLFEVVLHVAVQDKEETVTLRAPGTITAHFDNAVANVFEIKTVSVRLTSAALLKSMVEQARMVVLKTVATVTKTHVPSEDFNAPSGQLRPTPEDSQTPSTPQGRTKMSASASLAGFRSALDLSTDPAAPSDNSPRLQKARSSALRLNSVLHHKSPGDGIAGNLGIRKVRSVKWDTPIQPPRLGGALAPSPKKPKTTNAARLKSFKSFGRAHAEDFNSGPRNATFAEFERPQFWGRNGRLAAHPQPRQAGHSEFTGHTAIAERNATFDLNSPIGRQSHVRNTGTSPTQVNSAMPRSTTALEMFVLKKSTSGGSAARMR